MSLLEVTGLNTCAIWSRPAAIWPTPATIVLAEQNLASALTLAQRACIINNGHIAHEGPTSRIKARPQVLERHLGVQGVAPTSRTAECPIALVGWRSFKVGVARVG